MGSRGGFKRSFGGRDNYNEPPSEVIEMGYFIHATAGDIVCKSTNAKIPYFNAPIYLQNKRPIGKVDEILGPLNEVYFTIKPSEGVLATSYKKDDKFYIAAEKLLPIERFLPKPAADKASKPKGPKGARGGGRGGFGGGRGGGRGGARGGFGGGRGGGRGGSFGGGRGGGFGGGRGGGRGGGFGGGRGGGGGGRGGFGGGRGGGRGRF